MARVDTGRPFFISNMTSFDPRDRTDALFPQTRTMQRGLFSIGTTAMPYFFSRAPREKALVVGCSGLNTHVLLEAEDVTKLNDAGISVIWLGLPPIRHNNPFIEDYQRVAKAFFTSRHSPVRVLFPEEISRSVLTHSTGGQIYWALKQDAEAQKKLERLYAGEMHIAPFFDTANASRGHAPLFNRVAFAMYSRRNLERKPGETALGRAYLRLKAFGEKFCERPSEQSPTYGQILEVQNAGRRLTDTFNPPAKGAASCVLVYGDRDPFACHKTGAAFAARVGARLHIVPGAGHNPLEQAPALLDGLIRDIAAQAETRPKREIFAAGQARPAWHGLEGTVRLESCMRLSERLRYRAGLTFEGGARFLDSTAGLFEGAFGRRIRNAEMRGQAESHPLHGGHALGLQ